MLGGPDDPDATLGAPDGITAGWIGRFEATARLVERRLCALRLTAWCGFATRCGACTVMVGNVPGLAEGLLAGGLLAGALLGSAGAGLAVSGADCAWAEAAYSNPGKITAVKAS
jgi:hypothetical protein